MWDVDWVHSIFQYLLWFSRYKGSKNCTNPPRPQIRGKYWSDCTGYGRFSIRGQMQHTPEFSTKSVISFVRYPLTNLFCTDRQTDTHTDRQT